MESSFLIIVGVVLVLLFLLVIFFEVNARKSVFAQKKKESLDQLEQLRSKLTTREINATLCIVQADTIFDKMFGVKTGSTAHMGDKLKQFKTLFRKEVYNEIWEAHKLRNKAVHENANLTDQDANKTINIFKKAIYDF